MCGAFEELIAWKYGMAHRADVESNLELLTETMREGAQLFALDVKKKTSYPMGLYVNIEFDVGKSRL